MYGDINVIDGFIRYRKLKFFVLNVVLYVMGEGFFLFSLELSFIEDGYGLLNEIFIV